MPDWLVSTLAGTVTTATLVAGLAWLCREWIATRLTASVRRETEKKLIEFQARLDAAESQVSDVRRAGIEAMHQSNAAVLAQRVTATQEIWKAVVDWRRATAMVFVISHFSEKQLLGYADDASGRETMATMLGVLDFDATTKRSQEIEMWRPFVSEKAWSVWASLSAFYLMCALKVKVIQKGDKSWLEGMFAANRELRLVREAASPELIAEYERDVESATPKVITYLETELLAELRRGLAGEDSGPEAARHAAKVIAVAQSLIVQAQAAKV